MKRIISWALLAVMVLSLFAGCSSNAPAPAADPTNAPAAAAPTEAVVVADDNLENAIAYLKAFYKTVRDGDQTPSDFERLGTVRVGLTAYEVVYTVDCDESAVKVVKGDNGTVLIDVNEDSEVEVPYALTATVTGTDGKTASLTWNHVLPVSMNGRGAEIVDAAYALEEGEAMAFEVTLTGEIIGVDTPYSPDYKNITVSIKVAGREDKPIMCYRLKGEGCDKLMPGDIITVSGIIKNYKGTIEFDAGCMLLKAEKSANSLQVLTDPQEILEAAFKLKGGECLPYPVTLTGKIVGIKTPYSAQYGNISVVIKTGEPWYDITCYRMKGQDVDKIGRDDVITVTGTLKNYGGHTIEFDTGSIMESWVDMPDPKCPDDPAEIMKQANKLVSGSSLPYYCYLTGPVESIRTKWNPVNGYVRLSINVAGTSVDCYRLRGDDIENIKVGDTITVWGKIEKYQGAVQIYTAQLISPSDKELVDDLYDLKAGESIADAMLTGVITSVDKPYSGSSVTVTMSVEGKKTKPVQCVNLTGLGADLLEVGDTIEVAGKLTNNAGSYQFASGCKLMAWTNVNVPKVDNHSSNAEVLAAAKLLGVGQRLMGVCLEGTITQVNTAYSSKYGNITVTINVDGQNIRCNRLGDNKAVAKLGAGDFIKVYGKLWKKADGGLEFQNDCGLVAYTLSEKNNEKPATLKEQLDDAVANGTNTYESTIQGKIVGVPAYQGTQYDNWNFTVRDEASGLEVYCHNLAKGLKLYMGDVVKVSGCLTSYNGKAQFARNPGATVTVISSSGGADIVKPATLKEQLDDAVKNGTNPYESSIQGTIVGTPAYQGTQYDNWNFTVRDSATGLEVYCHNLAKGLTLHAGDVVKVSGCLTSYNGKAQFARTPGAVVTVISSAGADEECKHEATRDEVTLAATCGATGLKNVVCDECGEVVEKDVEIPATGAHSYVEGICGACGAADPDYVPCEHAVTIDEVTLAPTCGATGLKDVICDDCDKVVKKDVEIPATGAHSYVEGICGACGAADPDYVAPVDGEGGEGA